MLARVCDSVKDCHICLNFDGFVNPFHSAGNKCLTCGDSRKIEVNPRYIPLKSFAANMPRGDYEE